MKELKLIIFSSLTVFSLYGSTFPVNAKKFGTPSVNNGSEKYRPQLHFSISRFWINDPNGLVYMSGEYHLFYQVIELVEKYGVRYLQFLYEWFLNAV